MEARAGEPRRQLWWGAEQPWRTAGRKVAAPRAQLDLAWVAAMNSPALRRVVGTVPLIVGGRSAGARVACRTAQEVGAAGVLALAFPLHPPGRPELSRVGELLGAVSSPVLVVQGARDPFGRPSEFPADPPVVSIPYADHGFAVPRRSPTTQEEVIDQIVEAAVSGFGKNFRVALLEPA